MQSHSGFFIGSARFYYSACLTFTTDSSVRYATINASNCLGGADMAVFRIPNIPKTTNKTIRIPNDLVEGVEQAIRGKECTFSAFVVAAIRIALEEVAEQQKRDKSL